MILVNKLKEKKVYVILIILISIIIGTIVSLKITEREYISSTTLLLVRTQQLEEESKNLGNVEISNKLMSTFKEILKSDTTIQKIKSELDIDIQTKELNKSICIKQNTKADTFQIEVKNTDEQKSIDINNKLINIFSEKLEEMYSDTDINIVDNPHIIKTVNNISIILSIIISIIIGVIINLSYLFILIIIEKNVKINENIEKEINLKSLIEIPLKVDKKIKNELIAYDSEKTTTSKAFGNLRSNIQFMNVNNKEKKIILITSPSAKEGKSYIAANIAISFAEVGKKVILIDADMKSGRQSEIFSIPNNLGFSNYLSSLDTNGVEISKLTNNFINESAIKNLNIITSGTIPPNTSELLASDRLNQLIKDLSVFYDVVIIDGTSVLNSLDALILSRACNATILVSDYKKTRREDILKAKKDIQNIGGNPTGIIVNRVKIKNENNNKQEIEKIFINSIKKIKKYIKKIAISIKSIKNTKEERKPKLLTTKSEVKENKKIDFNKKEQQIVNTNNKKKKKELVASFVKHIKTFTINFIKLIKKHSLILGKKIKEKSIKGIKFTKNNGEKFYKIIKKYSYSFTQNVKNLSIRFIKYINPIIKKNISNIKNNIIKSASNIKKKSEERKLTNKQKKEGNILNVEKEHNISNSIQNNSLNNKEIEQSRNIIKPVEIKLSNENNIKPNPNVRISNRKVNKENQIRPIENSNIENNIDLKITNNIKNTNNNLKIVSDSNLESKSEYIAKNKEVKDNYSKKSSIKSTDITNKIELEDLENEKGDNAVLVIVDAEKACCRVFSKYYYTEKLIKGIDKNDGFKKNHYSIQLMKTKINGLMSLYGLNKKQVQRIDTLIYTTLLDYDDCAWLDKKVISNRAESYVLSMAKEYDRLPNESKQDYIVRCQRLRKQELEEAEIDIEYKLDNLWKNNKISIPNKITLKNFANLYEIKESFKSNQEIEKSTENKKFYVDIVKTIKSKLENNTVPVDDKYIEDENSGFYELEEGEEKVIDYEKEEKVKKRQERMETFKEKLKEQTELFSQKREEKIKKQEELKRQKEEERQRLREEARIEEELLVNNLYPKTKNNRNIYK